MRFDKWLAALWMLVNCKNGISSYEIHRAIGHHSKVRMVHAASAFGLPCKSGSFVKLGGPGTEVEVDETFIGGKARNMHAKARRREGVKDVGAKAIVIGVLQRGGKVHAKVAPNRKKESFEAVIYPAVEEGATVYTDEFPLTTSDSKNTITR